MRTFHGIPPNLGYLGVIAMIQLYPISVWTLGALKSSRNDTGRVHCLHLPNGREVIFSKFGVPTFMSR